MVNGLALQREPRGQLIRDPDVRRVLVVQHDQPRKRGCRGIGFPSFLWPEQHLEFSTCDPIPSTVPLTYPNPLLSPSSALHTAGPTLSSPLLSCHTQGHTNGHKVTQTHILQPQLHTHIHTATYLKSYTRTMSHTTTQPHSHTTTQLHSRCKAE